MSSTSEILSSNAMVHHLSQLFAFVEQQEVLSRQQQAQIREQEEQISQLNKRMEDMQANHLIQLSVRAAENGILRDKVTLLEDQSILLKRKISSLQQEALNLDREKRRKTDSRSSSTSLSSTPSPISTPTANQTFLKEEDHLLPDEKEIDQFWSAFANS